MAKFGNNDDDFNDDEFNDEFRDRWEEFNRMMNDKHFRRDMDKFRLDLEELMRLISSKRDGIQPINFRFMPLDDFNMGNIPDDEMETKKGEDENGEWETKHWTSPDGSMSFTSFTRSSSFDDVNNIPDEMAEMFDLKPKKEKNPEQAKKVKLAKLQKTLDYLVEQEKYEKAAEVKKMIDELNNPSAATEGENNA